jgi:hypothetical protein
MSDASQSINSDKARAPREEEVELICSLLRGTSVANNLKDTLRNSRVVDLKDGNMGSIRFMNAEPRKLGQVFAEADYLDDDGVCVSIAINTDNKGDLFELDFWKVDFSALRRYPKPCDVLPAGSCHD